MKFTSILSLMAAPLAFAQLDDPANLAAIGQDPNVIAQDPNVIAQDPNAINTQVIDPLAAPVGLDTAAAPVDPALANQQQVAAIQPAIGQSGVQVTQQPGSQVQVSQQSVNGQDVVNIAAPAGSVTEVIVIWVNNGGNAATSTLNQAQPLGTGVNGLAPVAGNGRQPIKVTVGGPAGLQFNPSIVEAQLGDLIEFEFLNANHTVTQSAFETPCDPLQGGFDSGFMPNPNNSVIPAPRMQMQVMVDTPIWFYCRQNAHCGKGMVLSVNPTAEKTHADFQSLAIQQRGQGALSAIQGGQGAPAPANAPPAAGAPPAQQNAPGAPPANLAGPGAMVPGQGNMQNGQCSCSCLCGQAAFPNPGSQGLGMFGGMGGSMPLAAVGP